MKFKSLYPPVCIQGPVSNKWYIIADGVWHHVRRNYSWSELEKMWEKIVFTKTDIVKSKANKQEWKVDGSKGKKYTIVNDKGYWSCDCLAHSFGRGKDCKHITQIKSKL